jgi:hypothetical protein
VAKERDTKKPVKQIARIQSKMESPTATPNIVRLTEALPKMETPT